VRFDGGCGCGTGFIEREAGALGRGGADCESGAGTGGEVDLGGEIGEEGVVGCAEEDMLAVFTGDGEEGGDEGAGGLVGLVGGQEDVAEWDGLLGQEVRLVPM